MDNKTKARELIRVARTLTATTKTPVTPTILTLLDEALACVQPIKRTRKVKAKRGRHA